MYKPLFNTVLVEIKQDEWARARGNDESLGGEVYREGTLIEVGFPMPTSDYPEPLNAIETIMDFAGREGDVTVMWNEGHEAGTIFEEDGKMYALLYWWDLRGAKNEQ